MQQSRRSRCCRVRSCLCSHKHNLLLPGHGSSQRSAYQWLHTGALGVNLMARYGENKLLFLISACNFHFVSPEHVCSILASLLRNLRGQQRTRLLNKFTENDSEKVSVERVCRLWVPGWADTQYQRVPVGSWSYRRALIVFVEPVLSHAIVLLLMLLPTNWRTGDACSAWPPTSCVLISWCSSAWLQ